MQSLQMQNDTFGLYLLVKIAISGIAVRDKILAKFQTKQYTVFLQ